MSNCEVSHHEAILLKDGVNACSFEQMQTRKAKLNIIEEVTVLSWLFSHGDEQILDTTAASFHLPKLAQEQSKMNRSCRIHTF